jgi:hypothetical protein
MVRKVAIATVRKGAIAMVRKVAIATAASLRLQATMPNCII